ncbi:hypothetical protein ILYODFUR_025444 [Ilyodon furcidens]|uniref:Uncharacterized protein n=1 Tax=Ilyodon furcidens TaxID=33524 RepID=A0ABV0TB19_9TELE
MQGNSVTNRTIMQPKLQFTTHSIQIDQRWPTPVIGFPGPTCLNQTNGSLAEHRFLRTEDDNPRDRCNSSSLVLTSRGVSTLLISWLQLCHSHSILGVVSSSWCHQCLCWSSSGEMTSCQECVHRRCCS